MRKLDRGSSSSGRGSLSSPLTSLSAGGDGGEEGEEGWSDASWMLREGYVAAFTDLYLFVR